jgi:hypothetical protein
MELRQGQLALSNLKMQAETEAAKEAAKEAISVDIKPTIHPSPEGKGYIICAVVELTNVGSRIKRIEWTGAESPFSVHSVRFRDDSVTADYDKLISLDVMQTRDPKSKAVSRVIRSSGKESISFAFRVSSAGLYLLSFRVPLGKEERVESKNAGANLPVAWTCNKYVLVSDTPFPSAKEADT